MKRILFACCLTAFSCAVSYSTSQAQATAPARPTISKTEFTGKVDQLNTLLTQNSNDAAQAKWGEVHKLLLSALATTKYNIKDAIQAGNDANKNRYTDVMMNQQKIYSQIMNLKVDMATNKTQLNTKLTEFGNTID